MGIEEESLSKSKVSGYRGSVNSGHSGPVSTEDQRNSGNRGIVGTEDQWNSGHRGPEEQ